MECQEEEPLSPVTTTPSTTPPGGSTVTVSSTRGVKFDQVRLLYNDEKQADLDTGKSAPAPAIFSSQPAPGPSVGVTIAGASLYQQPVPVVHPVLARPRSSQSDTFTTRVPSAESEHPRRSASDLLHQKQKSFSLSQILMEITPTSVDTPVIDTSTPTTARDMSTLSIHPLDCLLSAV